LIDSGISFASDIIWIYGVGGVGGYFGGKLAYLMAHDPEAGKRVFFITRGEHFKAIKQQGGLILNTAKHKEIMCIPYQVTDNLEDVPNPDLCLLCVKSYDLDLVVHSLAGKIKNSSIIIPILNGVDIYERVRTILKKGIVLPACAYVGTHIEKPGIVTQGGAPGIILCGQDPALKDFNPEHLVTLFTNANIKFNWTENPFPAIWEKFIFIAAFGLVTAYSEKTLGEVTIDPELRGLVEKIMGEIVAIARKREITLSHGKTSYQRDIEAKGRLNEGDLFGGTIIRMGKELGIPTLATKDIYEEIELRLSM
jgi:2-dehydropantoate 2-reductase